MKFTFILTTHNRPKEAARVMCELYRTCKPHWSNIELLVVCHNLFDCPEDPRLPPFRFVWNWELKGCATSIFKGVQEAQGEWFLWLCDDHTYPDSEWFEKLLEFMQKNPDKKVIGFNPGTGHFECCPIGAAEVKWFKDHYPIPVYEHYGWDNEIQDWAKAENVFGEAYHILIQDKKGPVNAAFKDKDVQRYEMRKIASRMVNGKMTCP